MVPIAPVPPPALCLPTFPNEEKALKPAAVHYFGLIEGKKQMRACHAVMVCKQFSTVEDPSPSGAELDAGTWGYCKAVCVPSCRRWRATSVVPRSVGAMLALEP